MKLTDHIISISVQNQLLDPRSLVLSKATKRVETPPVNKGKGF